MMIAVQLATLVTGPSHLLHFMSLAGPEEKDNGPEAREQRKHDREKERARRRMLMFAQVAAEIEKPKVEGFIFRYEPRSDGGTRLYTCCTHRELPSANTFSSLSPPALGAHREKQCLTTRQNLPRLS